MKIVQLITKAERGGAQSVVASLLDGLRERHSFTLLTGETGYLTAEAQRLGIPFHVISNLVQPVSPWRDFRALFELRALLRKLRPELLHAHSTKAGVLGRMAASMAGVPAVFTAHGWEFAPGLGLLRRGMVWPSEWVAARCCRKIICVSEEDRRLARRFWIAGAGKLEVVHNGIPDHALRAKPDATSEYVRFISVARLAPPKDFDTLLRALKSAPPVCRLSLVGAGPLEPQQRALAATLGLGERVEFLGDRADVPELLAASHAFVLSSRKEGLPISILEAMRAGLPVLATNVGGVSEAVQDKQTGLLVPVCNEAALVQGLTELAQDAAKRTRFGAAGRQRYAAEFTQSKLVEGVQTVYESIMG